MFGGVIPDAWFLSHSNVSEAGIQIMNLPENLTHCLANIVEEKLREICVLFLKTIIIPSSSLLEKAENWTHEDFMKN